MEALSRQTRRAARKSDGTRRCAALTGTRYGAITCKGVAAWRHGGARYRFAACADKRDTKQPQRQAMPLSRYERCRMCRTATLYRYRAKWRTPSATPLYDVLRFHQAAEEKRPMAEGKLQCKRRRRSARRQRYAQQHGTAPSASHGRLACAQTAKHRPGEEGKRYRAAPPRHVEDTCNDKFHSRQRRPTSQHIRPAGRRPPTPVHRFRRRGVMLPAG